MTKTWQTVVSESRTRVFASSAVLWTAVVWPTSDSSPIFLSMQQCEGPWAEAGFEDDFCD